MKIQVPFLQNAAFLESFGFEIDAFGENAENTVLEGCSFKGSVNGGTEENCGIVVGFLNGSSKKVTFGTSDAPVKIISGTINGTTLDSGNYTNHMHGSKNYKEGTHTFNVVFGK